MEGLKEEFVTKDLAIDVLVHLLRKEELNGRETEKGLNS